MAYIINGPVAVGDTSQNTTLNGNLILQVATGTGDLIYNSAPAGPMTNLPIGTTGQVLTVIAGVPAWTSQAADQGKYGFSGLLTATQAAVAGTPVTLAGFTVSGDPAYDTTAGDFVPSTGIFTVSASGNYQLNAQVSFLGTSNAGTRTVDLYNGTAPIFVRTIQPTGNNAITNVISISANMHLTAAATYTLRFTSSAGTTTIQATPQTFFGISRLSLD